MPDNLEIIINDIEEKWSKTIFNEVNAILSVVFLPSHDLNHHKRVWHFAKEILRGFSGNNHSFSTDFVEALLIAVFFHDTGLSITFKPEHGLESSRLAEKFLLHQSKNWDNPLTDELIQAIIRHDDKNYSAEYPQQGMPGIYHILTVADDLDALGCLGLVRYFEIYFHRNVADSEIIGKIETNILSRFNFIREQIKELPMLLKVHRQRFDKALSYLTKMNANDVVELKTIFEKKVDILNIDGNSFKSELLKELISEAGEEGSRH
jgi:HD superfamily phosphodiesterase